MGVFWVEFDNFVRHIKELVPALQEKAHNYENFTSLTNSVNVHCLLEESGIEMSYRKICLHVQLT